MGQIYSIDEGACKVATSCFDNLYPLERTTTNPENTSFSYKGLVLTTGSTVIVKTDRHPKHLAVITSEPYQNVEKKWVEGKEGDDVPFAETIRHSVHVTRNVIKVRWMHRMVELPDHIRALIVPLTNPREFDSRTDVFLTTQEEEEVPMEAIEDTVSCRPYAVHVPMVTNFR